MGLVDIAPEVGLQSSRNGSDAWCPIYLRNFLCERDDMVEQA